MYLKATPVLGCRETLELVPYFLEAQPNPNGGWFVFSSAMLCRRDAREGCRGFARLKQSTDI